MTGLQTSVPQLVRILCLGLYLAFLFAMNRMAFGQCLPLTSEKGLWFYSGAAALILRSLVLALAEPLIIGVYYSYQMKVAGA